MLTRLHITNFTVFRDAAFAFKKNLNVIIGENGAGKTHLLKLVYSVIAASAEEKRKPASSVPSKAVFQPRLADKLVNVFRPESLGRLARRKQGRERADVALSFDESKYDLEFGFSTQSKSEVEITRLSKAWINVPPAYLPTRELLSIYPGFIAFYESHFLEYEETWRDTCRLLGKPLPRGATSATVKGLLAPLEEAMGGSLEYDKNGRFYLVIPGGGRMEIPLVAEGLRKLAMVARLVATGALHGKGYLFWDEPEANLNPRMLKVVAKTIVDLSRSGVQVFIATHSLFLLRELDFLQEEAERSSCALDAAYFGLSIGPGGVEVATEKQFTDLRVLAVLDEELVQAGRVLEALANR
jgi:energy-coupling factor transporter ATP-binding protein EcfA2